ncbi:MAG: TVP38/TMEM64 family protein [Rhodospirillales bacterium]|nr:TVP38/TMEM64 family protein [Rhodospirillales bacterium]
MAPPVAPPVAPPATSRDAERRFSPWRLIPIGAILLGLIVVIVFGYHRYLSFEQIGAHRDALLAWRADHPTTAAVMFVIVYIVAVALSVPGAAWLTVVGGFLFGTIAATVFCVLAATVGSSVVFLAARSVLADVLRARAGPAIRKMEAGLRDDAFNYLLVLRLLPIFPFWLVNLVPAFLGVSLPTFLVGTLIGIVPGSLVYAMLGSGLADVIDAGRAPDLGIIFSPSVLAPLVGLALLSLAPVVYRRMKRRDAPSPDEPR